MKLEIDTQSWMERHGLEPEEAAKALGISRAQVYRHLAGRPLTRRTAFLMEMYDRDPVAMRELVGVASAEDPGAGGVELEGGQLRLVSDENEPSADELDVRQG